MLVAPDAPPQGTIGGGAMEFQLLARARQALADGLPTQLQELWHREDAPGDRSGMICAGRQTNLYRLCTPEADGGVVARAARCLREGRSALLRIAVSGMSLEEDAIDLARPAAALRKEMDDWVYEEQLLNLKRVAIIGGGHCGLALSRCMDQLGYHLVVIDQRTGLDTMTRNAHARERHVVQAYEDAGAMIAFPELTRVVVMTTDYPSDVQALVGALGKPFPFIGVMGSAAKITRILDALRDRGCAEAELASLHAPVGLRIHSHTPEEIAISVAAELIKEEAGIAGRRDP